jgi:hypothetical protein
LFLLAYRIQYKFCDQAAACHFSCSHYHAGFQKGLMNRYTHRNRLGPGLCFRITESLPLALEEIEPPLAIRQQLMARIQTTEATIPDLLQPSSGPSLWQQITAVFRLHKNFTLSYFALCGLVVILFISNVLLWQQINKLESGPEPGRTMAIRLNSTSVIPAADGYITISGDGLSGAIVLDRLPQLQQDQQYQLWLVKDEQRTSAALLSVDELGYGARRVRAPESLFNYAWAEVTIEAAGGNAQPTTAVILNAPLFP